MKQPQQRTFNASRDGLGRRPLPLASLSGAALLLSLGLLQNAAAEPIRVDAPLTPQLNSETAKIEGTITDPKGIASGADFLAPLATSSAVNVSGNGAASNATGNASIPKGAFSLDINNELEIARARAILDQTNNGEVTSVLESQAVISGVTGASNAAATVTKNIFDANATGNQALTSIGIQATGSVALSNAGVRLISRQLNESPDISAQSTTITGVALDGASRANTATVTGNTTASQAVNNNADNAIAITSATGIDATGTRAAALTLRNRQEVTGGWDAPTETGVRSDLTAATVNRTGVFAQDANISRGSFTVNDNQVSASAQRNLASNVMGVAEGAVSTGTLPLFFLTNKQMDATVGATISATTTAEVLIDVTGSGVGRNLQATISGNQISAAAGANTASNEVFLGTAGSASVAPTRVGDLASVSGALENTQRGASDVQATTQGYASMVGATLTGALSVSNNTTQASASGNQADNTFGALANSADALDVSVTSVQRYGNTDVAPSVTSTATGSAGIQANSPAATAATVTGNTLASQAMVNTARNRASLDSTTTLSNSTLAVGNLQTSRASAESLTELEGFGIFSTGQLIGDNVSVSGNLASAKATQNVATNALSVKAGAISGPATTDMPDYGVYNLQKSFESTTATVQTAITDFGPVSAGVFVPTSLPANISVTNNVLSAVARANVADNQLQASSTTTLTDASFLLGNSQLNRGDATASITPAGLGVNNGMSDTLAPRVSVSGNQLEAAASGNAAFNALSVDAGTSFTASAMVLNAQNNAGFITASIDSPTLGLQAFNAMPGQVTSVTGNSLNASAYGNHAVNSVALSALPGQLSASAALVSGQINSGNVIASVSNTFIGSNVTAVNGSTTVARNQVNANAVGNMAIGSMVIGSK